MIRIIENKEEIDKFFEILEKRGDISEGAYLDSVKEIIKNVKLNKDKALEEYTKKFDDPNFTIDKLKVTKEELKQAFESLDDETKRILTKARDRIKDYHEHLIRNSFIYEEKKGERLGMKVTPLESAGVYVPGGKASYPSSVFMNVMPAKVAGVENVSVVTPAVKGYINPLVLAACYLADVDNVYKVGGAHAIAALAYGTESIAKVDKIVGPGNIYVALAKKEVYGTVGIDSIAGPSEICIVSDETSNPRFLACDLLGQAEHDELASSVLVTTSLDVALKAKEELTKIYETASRRNILEKSLTNYSAIIVVKSLDEAIDIANKIAPEHLELCFDKAQDYIDKVKNAGAIFVGQYSPESLGDYMAGPNHVLPTCKTARFFSPLGVDDFIKKSSIINFSKEACISLADDVNSFALSESLTMHALSIMVRKE